MNRRQFYLGLLFGFWALAISAFAQWPESADSNLAICTHASEQVLPKIAATSDGGCYISWYDLASGNYDVYLQRLDVNGVEQFAPNGLLISSHPQNSWITDWDMTVDAANHAILTVNDIRSGGDWDIYAYRISPAGDFVWGPDGIVVSDNAVEEYTPCVCATSAGNIVIGWQKALTDYRNDINLRKLSPEGDDIWSPAIITLTSARGLSGTRLVAAAGDNVILQYRVHQDTTLWSARHIYAQRFDSLGALMWGTGTVISNAGGVSAWMLPNIVPNGEDGVYCYWYDGRISNQLHVYVQNISAAGTPQWTANGVRVSMSAENQSEPALAVVPGAELITVFYMTSNSGQTEWGLGGQALNAAGALQWGNNGITFAALNDQQRSAINAGPIADGAVVSYLESIFGTENDRVKGFRVDSDGALVWPGSPHMLSSVASDKLDMVSATNTAGQFLNVWCDRRSDAGNIYLQNINPDGTLGPLGDNQPPGEFWRSFPQDSVLSDSLGIVGWTQSLDPDGDPVTYVVHLRSDYSYQFDPDSIYEYTTTDTVLDFGIMIPLSPLDEIFHFSWRVFATDGQDTVEAANGEGMFMLDIIMNSDDVISLPASFSLSAYPNPFNPITNIAFDLKDRVPVSLRIFDLLGREITTLVNDHLAAGHHAVTFDASGLPTGMYLCRLSAGDFETEIRLLLLK